MTSFARRRLACLFADINYCSVLTSEGEVRDMEYIIDVTFVDDEAIALVAGSPTVLETHIRRGVKVFAQVLSRYLMQLDFDKGKAEALRNTEDAEPKPCKASSLPREATMLLPQ